MSIAKLPFNTRDTACTDPYWGRYFTMYQYRDSPEAGARSKEFYLGRTAVSGEDALELAAEHLDNKDVLPAPAVVVRLCDRHEVPVIEIDKRVIAVQSAERICIPADPNGAVIKEEIDGTPYMRRRIVKPGVTGLLEDRDALLKVNYLLRADYGAAVHEHEGVVSYLGGLSSAINFGLLGGEELITVPALPDSRDH